MNASHPNINKLPPKGVIGAKNEKSNEVNFPRQRTKIVKEKSKKEQERSVVGGGGMRRRPNLADPRKTVKLE